MADAEVKVDESIDDVEMIEMCRSVENSWTRRNKELNQLYKENDVLKCQVRKYVFAIKAMNNKDEERMQLIEKLQRDQCLKDQLSIECDRLQQVEGENEKLLSRICDWREQLERMSVQLNSTRKNEARLKEELVAFKKSDIGVLYLELNEAQSGWDKAKEERDYWMTKCYKLDQQIQSLTETNSLWADKVSQMRKSKSALKISNGILSDVTDEDDESQKSESTFVPVPAALRYLKGSNDHVCNLSVL